jgi:hypothetical protein
MREPLPREDLHVRVSIGRSASRLKPRAGDADSILRMAAFSYVAINA